VLNPQNDLTKLHISYFRNYLALHKKNSRNMMLALFVAQSSLKSIQRKENSTPGPDTHLRRPGEEYSTHRQPHQVNQ
jgi:hypothetical protein